MSAAAHLVSGGSRCSGAHEPPAGAGAEEANAEAAEALAVPPLLWSTVVLVLPVEPSVAALLDELLEALAADGAAIEAPPLLPAGDAPPPLAVPNTRWTRVRT
jgi:hypothetical protein